MPHKELAVVRADVEDIRPGDKYVMIWRMGEGGVAVEEGVLNIRDGKFCIDQHYAFPVADSKEEDQSITVIRMTIPKGTRVTEGYNGIYLALTKLGVEPNKACQAMGFDEVNAGVGVALCQPHCPKIGVSCDGYSC